MPKEKKKLYFWLKIDENFYKNLAIKKARKLPGGDTMIVIYQRMMLHSLSTNGVLYYEGEMQNIDEELALNLDESVENISMTLSYFKASGLIQIDEEENAEMLQVPALLAQETNWAKYQRDRRNEKKEQAKLETVQPKLDNVQPVSNSCPTEIDIEIELDKELEIEQEKEQAATTLINKLSAALVRNRIKMDESKTQALSTELLNRGQGIEVGELYLIFVDCLQYAITNRKSRPVAYALTRLSENIKDGYTTLEKIQDKEAYRNAESIPVPPELPDVPLDVDVANVDWSKY